MRFRVTIRKEGQAEETRVMDAPSRFAVYADIEKEGGLVTHIKDASEGFRLPAWTNKTILGSEVKRSELIRFAKNVAAMLAAGLALSRALSIIERQSSSKRFKAIVADLEERIRGGSAFHEALAAHPKAFPGLFVAMVRAGEESGSLGDSLSVTALQMERAEELTKKVRGAMIYPSIVIAAVIIVAVLMLLYVVPTLTATFESLSVAVPLSTRAIVAISKFMVSHVVLVIGALAGGVVGGVAFVRSPRGRALVTAFALRLPVIGELVRETYAARASRTLASLLSAGVPVLGALSITSDTLQSPAFSAVVQEAQERVKKGEALSAAFAAKSKLYPLQMSDMIAVGEETGKVAEMLKQIAELYEADVAEKTKDLSTIIEPALMLFIGAVVGIFAVSMIAPIYSLSAAI